MRHFLLVNDIRYLDELFFARVSRHARERTPYITKPALEVLMILKKTIIKNY